MAYKKLDEIWVDDSNERLYRPTGETFTEVSPSTGGGGGEGVINYAKNPLEENNTSNLTYSGFTPSWGTTYNLYAGGAFKCEMSASGTGRYLRIALDDLSDAQITEMLRLSFFYKLTVGGADAVRLSIWNGTHHTYLTPEYLISASGDITKYDGWCYSISKTSHYLQLTFKDSTAITLHIANLNFAPRILPQGAVISEWRDYTPTFNGFGTPTNLMARWRRVGSSMEIQCRFSAGTVTNVEARVSLPAGLIIAGSGNSFHAGQALRGGVSSSLTTYYVLGSPGFGYLNFSSASATKSGYVNDLAHMILSTGDVFTFFASVPISGWTSSINLVTDAQEFASNSSSTDADDTTSFVYGPSGASGIIATTALTARRTKRVRFKNPIQPNDNITIELFLPSTGAWVGGSIFIGGYGIQTSYVYINAEGGMQIEPVAGSNTDLNIVFQRYPIGSTSYGWNYSGYAGIKWRVRKISNGNMAEAPASGIYESGSNSNGYYVKYTDGTMICWLKETVAGTAGTAYNHTAGMSVFPAIFAEAPAVTLNPNYDSTSTSSVLFYNFAMNVDTTGFTYRSAGIKVQWTAIGKWNLSRSVAAPGTPVGASTVFAAAYRTGAYAPSSLQPYNYNTIVEDSLGCITTGSSWKFTAPVAGLYLVTATIPTGASTYSALYKNEAPVQQLGVFGTNTAMNAFPCSAVVRLAQGDYISMRSTFATSISSPDRFIQITRLSA